MPVIGHQAVCQNPHLDMPGHFDHHAFKCAVIRGLIKNLHPRVPAIEHVEDHPAGLTPGRTRHGRRVSHNGRDVNLMYLSPFLYSYSNMHLS